MRIICVQVGCGGMVLGMSQDCAVLNTNEIYVVVAKKEINKLKTPKCSICMDS